MLDVVAGRRDWHVEQSDALEALRRLPDGCVQVCATSPPFFGLRDYGTALWTGGDPTCTHKVRPPGSGIASIGIDGGAHTQGHQQEGYRGDCRRCGATRTDQQIGLEPTLEQYVAALVEVFREVKRVLHPTGTLWLNVGDSYATNPGNGRGGEAVVGGHRSLTGTPPHRSGVDKTRLAGVKTKDLLGVPWEVAFALRADGWYLRSDIIWAKTACMPESVTDRPTSSHEHVFLFAKSARYYYDAAAVREPAVSADDPRNRSDYQPKRERNIGGRVDGYTSASGAMSWPEGGRNLRNVWTLGPEPLKSDHYAAWPTEIPRRAILAGSSERGICPTCENPWRRVVERTAMVVRPGPGRNGTQAASGEASGSRTAVTGTMLAPPTSKTTGWEPTCTHGLDPVPAVVLDPFSGSGRTVLTALNLGRRAIGIELSGYQCQKSRDRIVGDKPLFNTAAAR